MSNSNDKNDYSVDLEDDTWYTNFFKLTDGFVPSSKNVDKMARDTMKQLDSSVREANQVMTSEMKKTPQDDLGRALRTILDQAEEFYEEQKEENARSSFAEKMKELRMLNISESDHEEMGEVVDEAVILEDVVNEQYSIADVKASVEGPESLKTPGELSVLQLFDAVNDQYKEKNEEILKKVDPANFLEMCEQDDLEMMLIAEIDEIVMNAGVGIDMMASMRTQRNEALDALDALHKAEAMFANEKCLKNTMELIKTKKREIRDLIDELDIAMAGPSNRTDPKPKISVLDAAAAAAGALKLKPGLLVDSILESEVSAKDSVPNISSIPLEYSIKYDLSFLPSEDPDVYKPLEIVSYIGMTKPIGVADPVN